MIATLLRTQQLAARIQLAYLRRRPWWRPTEPQSRLWVTAAATLLYAQELDSRLPLDPELFVAAQPASATIADPWGELTTEAAIRRYRLRILKIVRRLREEMRAEIQWAERRICRGRSIESVLHSRSRVLTPLGRFIVAHRASRPDLAEPFQEAAQAQHLCCPLYKTACRCFLPQGIYPGELPSCRAEPSLSNSFPPYSLN